MTRMEISNEILTELLEITPFLASKGITKVPYTVPAGYFGDFTEILMIRILFEASGFGKPAGRNMAEISPLEEISGISPILAGLKDKNPYRAPEGYFEGLKAKIPGGISSKVIEVSAPVHSKSIASHARQISMPMRIVRYAAAACIVGLIGIVAYNITGRQNIDPINSLTSVSELDMANFLDAADVHWTPDNSPAPEIASADFNENEIHELLSVVPDTELEQYSIALPEVKRSVN